MVTVRKAVPPVRFERMQPSHESSALDWLEKRPQSQQMESSAGASEWQQTAQLNCEAAPPSNALTTDTTTLPCPRALLGVLAATFLLVFIVCARILVAPDRRVISEDEEQQWPHWDPQPPSHAAVRPDQTITAAPDGGDESVLGNVSDVLPPALERPCACSNREGSPAHTFYEPASVDPASDVACLEPFNSFDFNVVRLLHARTDEHPCAAYAFAADDLTLLRACMDPPRGGAYPQTVVWMFGDSHCLTHIPPMHRALRGRASLVPICIPAAPWNGVWYSEPAGSAHVLEIVPHADEMWRLLRAHLHPQDVLCVLNSNSRYDFEWLRSTVMEPLTRPRNVSLLLLGDNPFLTVDAHASSPSHPIVQETAGGRRYILEGEAQAAAFAAQHADVYAFPMAHLWFRSDLPAASGATNFVPGTRLNAFVDTNHLNVGGSLFLWPYLCVALEGWGLV